MNGNKLVVGALGDSITTAFNAKDPQDNWAHSWATGEAFGHAARIAALYPQLHVERHNVAVSGARAVDLRRQVERLVKVAPDYATLLVGANDLTYGLHLPTRSLVSGYKAEVADALARLIAASPRIMIVLAGVPNQAQLLELLPFDFDAGLVGPLRAMYLERWEAFNAALADLAQKHAANVRFSTAPALAKFGREHLSPLDRYHPSQLGQQYLAELTWREGWLPSA
jgi:lysophospholipase L1-like esterase